MYEYIRILRFGSSRKEPRESPDCVSPITYPRANESLLGRFSAAMIYFIALIGLLYIVSYIIKYNLFLIFCTLK